MKYVILIVLITVLFLLVGCSTDSLKEYRLNPDNYVDQTITFTAEFANQGSPDVEILKEFGTNIFYNKFVDNEGYFINVISKNRKFEIGQIYTVTGKYIKTSHGNYYLIE